ncbi:MAG: hypothetical protein HQL71_09625 [Magnetococcales bacterium]|nr:hypothetical protein [Magnetococcales bacterium]
MTDTFKTEDPLNKNNTGHALKAESKGVRCKGVAILLQAKRRINVDNMEHGKISRKKQANKNIDASHPFQTTELSPRAVPVEITDPWNASDRSEKSPIQRLKKLAIEIGQIEGDSSNAPSPLENFIRSKASSKSSSSNNIGVPFVKSETVKETGTVKKQKLKNLQIVGSISTDNTVDVKVEAKPQEKTYSKKHSSYNKNVGLPFTTTETSKKLSLFSKTITPQGLKPTKKALVKDKKIIARIANSQQTDRPTIKRKQTMRKPSTLQAIFSNQLPLAPVIHSNKSRKDNKISVVPSDKKFGVLVEANKLNESRVDAKTSIKNEDSVPKEIPMTNLPKQQDSVELVEQVTKAEKIVSLAEETIKQKAKEQKPSTFKPVVSGTDDIPLDTSQTLFSIEKLKPQQTDNDIEESGLSDILNQQGVGLKSPDLSSQESTTNYQNSVDVSVKSKGLSDLLAEKYGKKTIHSPTIMLPDLAEYSGSISNIGQQDTNEFNIAFNSVQVKNMDNSEEQLWTVPVEPLGSGVANALGNAVGNVVYIGKVISGNSGKKPKKKLEPKAKTITAVKEPIKRGQRVKELMANKVGSGVGGIFTGVGQMAQGSANVVIGTLGFLGGALVCLVSSNSQPEEKINKIKKV